MWPFFDSAEADARDTELGQMAALGERIEFSLDITTHAEQNIDPDAMGGIVDEDGPVTQTGGDLDPLPFAALVALATLSGVALVAAVGARIIVGAVTKPKKVVVVPPPVVPKKEEEPAPIPEPVRKPKRKRVKKKRIIDQNPGRWQNHKKLTKRKKRRSKKRRLGL